MPRQQHDVEGYRECYVAFLDILGFKELVFRSESNPELLGRLSRLTAVSAQLKPGAKQTHLGLCPMQTRSFSDCVAVFTPTRPGAGFANDGLVQLLFVVRFIHDEVLKLETCVRGAVTIGKMYWHPQWSCAAFADDQATVAPLPLTFGPGLVAAYELESKRAKVPRVLVDKALCRKVTGDTSPNAYPFGKDGTPLSAYLRQDADGEHHLDLLHRDVTRSDDESMRVTANGFVIEWNSRLSLSTLTRDRARKLAEDGIRKNGADACVRGKLQWLSEYAVAAEALPMREAGRLHA